MCLRFHTWLNVFSYLMKVIIVDVVLDPTSSMDLQTLLRTGGKERTEEEWKKLIQSAGYKGYKISTSPGLSPLTRCLCCLEIPTEETRLQDLEKIQCEVDCETKNMFFWLKLNPQSFVWNNAFFNQKYSHFEITSQ